MFFIERGKSHGAEAEGDTLTGDWVPLFISTLPEAELNWTAHVPARAVFPIWLAHKLWGVCPAETSTPCSCPDTGVRGRECPCAGSVSLAGAAQRPWVHPCPALLFRAPAQCWERPRASRASSAPPSSCKPQCNPSGEWRSAGGDGGGEAHPRTDPPALPPPAPRAGQPLLEEEQGAGSEPWEPFPAISPRLAAEQCVSRMYCTLLDSLWALTMSALNCALHFTASVLYPIRSWMLLLHENLMASWHFPCLALELGDMSVLSDNENVLRWVCLNML